MIVSVHPDLQRLIERSPVTGADMHAALSIASTIHEKGVELKNAEEYIHLHSRIIGRIYGTRVGPRALQLLRSLHAIEVKDDYLPATLARHPDDAFTMSYRLAPAFRDAVETEIDAPKLEARIDAALTTASYACMAGNPRRWVIASYKRLSFDDTAAAKLAAIEFANEMSRSRGTNAYLKTARHAMRFTAGRKKSGRVFYPVCYLPRDLRPTLLIDGEPTVELDIAACQPSLLATLLPADCPERTRYLEFVSRPGFYETFAEWAGEDWDRDGCKKEFFNQISYGSAFCAEKYALLPRFTAEFPTLAAAMKRIKLGPGGNSALPVRMQRLESEIVIDGAVAECARLEIPVLTVHDSLIARTRDAATVAEILGRHWLEKTGIPARVKGQPPADVLKMAA